ncbi:MAG TPA: diguanylate cyclase [Anaeromyxobacteraceae bacterium]|nr:diguanylate cyclase [Anaeromyxobacteraceae bacterium]
MISPATSLPGTSAARPALGDRVARRRSRPLIVRLYASVLSDLGVLGRPARRRALAFLLRSVPAAVTVLVGALVALGAFAAAAPGWIQAGALAALAASLAAAVWRRTAGTAEGRPAPLREQMELGSLFVVAAYALAQAAGAGAAESPLQPLVYLVMAFLVAFLPRVAGFALVGLALLLELLLWRERGGRPWDLAAAMIHSGFVALFAVLYHAVLAGHVAAGRRFERAAVTRRLAEIEERARSLRLLGPGGIPPHGEASWTAAAVVEVEAAVSGVLEVAEAALRCRTCAVLLLSADDRELRLSECRSSGDGVASGPLPAGEGALGAVLKTGRPVRLHGDMKPPSYALDGKAPGALLAVPLVEPRGGHLRGVVVADRAEAEPFTEGDERVLTALAAEIVRAAEAERLMRDLRRTRDEKERLFAAVERLNRLAKPAEVFEATLEIARELGGSEFAALTLVEPDGERRVHRVTKASGAEAAGAPGLEGKAWPDDDASLVASVVKLNSRLPVKDIDVARSRVFDAGTRLSGLASLRILPLTVSGEVLGTLVVGSTRPGAYGGEVDRQADFVAMQAADSILRARLYGETERLATTDGLTGLLNHRTFQARLDEVLAQARRYGKRASLLLCDIDHFKVVNDTYGHPIGDQVLRGVARILAREARTTDLTARYGGEEFAILMPETDPAGAAVIAERIRERVAAQVFETGQGPVRVTLSLGVAGHPEDADRKTTLVERADACLYRAKREGRNRTVTASGALARLPPPRRSPGAPPA